MNALYLRLLGQLRLEQDGQEVTGFRTRRAVALLAYLVCQPRPVPRSRLVELIWPDKSEERGRANLRWALNHLSNLLPDCWQVARQSVQFCPNENCVVDTLRLTQALADGEPNQLATAVADIEGEFLRGFYLDESADFETWLLTERELWRQQTQSALEKLIEHHHLQRNYEKALHFSRQLLDLDPWQEDVHRWVMRLLARQGRYTEALQQYEQCRRILEEELGAEPGQETQTLFQELQQAANTPRHNLPPLLTSFVGREAELAQINTMLKTPDCRLLTLVGPGGIGKTRLALAAAKTQVNAFFNGVTFVPLAGVTPATDADAVEPVITDIATALRFSFSGQQSPREQLLNYLHDKELLLLLDNFEQLRAASALLVEILQQAAGIKLLVTSRERLNISPEWALPLEGLPYPPADTPNNLQTYPAVQLFEQSARRIKPDFTLADNAAAVAQICRLVEGFPLGLELAAGWVRVIPCAEIVREIERNLDALAVSSATTPNRHRSMRATLDYSWNLLSPAEQQTFQRLSVFREGFERHAAEQVANVTLPLLSGLVDKSFLRHTGTGRYEIHELMRQFGAEKLSQRPKEEQSTRQKHAIYFAQFLEHRAESLLDLRNKSVLTEIDCEIENIRAGWQWLAGRQDIETAAPYLENLWYFYKRKGWFQEALPVLQQGIAFAAASNTQKARWYRMLSEACMGLGKHQKARQYIEQSLVLLEYPLPKNLLQFGSKLSGQLVRHMARYLKLQSKTSVQNDTLLELANADEQAAYLAYFANDPKITIFSSLRGLNTAQKLGPSPELARAHSTWSLICGFASLHGRAKYHFQQAETMSQQMASQQMRNIEIKITILTREAVYYSSTGEWSKADAALEAGITLAKDHNIWRSTLELYLISGWSLFRRGQFIQSLEQYKTVYQLSKKQYNLSYEGMSLNGVGGNYLRMGHLKSAIDNLYQTDALILHVPENNLYVSINKGWLIEAHLYNNEPEKAQSVAKELIDLLDKHIPTTLESYVGLAQWYLSQWELLATHPNGDKEQLKIYQTHTRNICKSLRRFARFYPIGKPHYLLAQGHYEWLTGKHRRAQNLWEKCITAAEQLKTPYEQAKAHYELGRHLSANQTTKDGLGSEAHLNRACQIFAELSADYDLSLAEKALGD